MNNITVEQAICGTYDFFFQANPYLENIGVLDKIELLGFLHLYCDGKYEFQFIDSFIEMSAIHHQLNERFHFIEHLQGNYHIELYENITNDTLILQLTDKKIFATLLFEDATNNDNRKTFLLRLNKVHKQICFHSINNEFELWKITRSLID